MTVTFHYNEQPPIDYKERASGYLDAQSFILSAPPRDQWQDLLTEALKGSAQHAIGFLSALTQYDTYQSLALTNYSFLFPLGFKTFLDLHPSKESHAEAHRCIRPFIAQGLDNAGSITPGVNSGPMHLRRFFAQAVVSSGLLSPDQLSSFADELSDFDFRPTSPSYVPPESFDFEKMAVALEAVMLERETQPLAHQNNAIPPLSPSRPRSI